MKVAQYLICLWLIFLPTNTLLPLVSAQCQHHQRSLLLQIKNTLIFDSTRSVRLSQWNQSADCCTWNGVECDPNGLVTGLDLNNESISGGIDNLSGLFSLQDLQRLNLAFNKFWGSQIPSGLGNLTRLNHLNLSYAGFAGQIPVEISSLTRLVVLDLSRDELELENPNLKMLVRNLTELRELYLDSVNISAQGGEWCQVLSSSLLKLQILSMRGCSLSGPIHHSLADIHSLTEIYLGWNELLSPIPGFIANFTNLKILSMGGAGLRGNFPQEILKMPSLQRLELAENEMLGGSLPEFPPNMSLQFLDLTNTNFSGTLPISLQELKNLSFISLENCDFSGPIPKSISKLTQLVELNFKSNSLRGEIPPSLFTLPSLERIDLSHNQFEGPLSEFSLPFSSILTSIDLSGNRLDGLIPMSIFQLKALNLLDISYNNFSGTLPLESFETFENLTYLDLSYNRLTVTASTRKILSNGYLMLASCDLGVFPNLQNQLVMLDLSNNKIPGEIPNWLWDLFDVPLSYLNLSHNSLTGFQEPYNQTLPIFEWLDLSSNQLQGNVTFSLTHTQSVDLSNNFSGIPAEIGFNFADAWFFSLSNNSLTGEIPNSFCNMSLQVLDLSYNHFSGGVPKCLMQVGNLLQVLNLKGNNVSGNISDTFSKDCGLVRLSLNGNQLQGSIPKSLANCGSLELLDLGKNQIDDVFPCWLKTVSNLQILILRSNKFYGSIDCSKIDHTWSNLQILDLALNNFNGNISIKSLSNWTAMMMDENEAPSYLKYSQFEFLPGLVSPYYDAITVVHKGTETKVEKILRLFTLIDLSCNNFDGSIPEEIGDFKSLHGLNISHNALTSSIPSSVGNMKQLEWLDLSMNKLSGTIPSQLGNLNFLSVLNLSHNHFTGKIPTGTQIQSFLPSSFEGNVGLCGPPLKDCLSTSHEHTSNPKGKVNQGNIFSWQFALFVGVGFGSGFVAAVAPLIFSDRVDLWYATFVNELLHHFRK